MATEDGTDRVAVVTGGASGIGNAADRVAVVTGGASGIGRATAVRLARDGRRVAVLDRDGAGAEATAVGIGETAIGLAVDVTDAAAVVAAIEQVLSVYGRIDTLVNGAGITGTSDATTCHATTVEEWDRVVAVNLRGPFLCARAVLPTMLDQGSGHIVTIASIAGIAATPGRSAYSASKGGALMLAKSLAADYAAHGIRANAICPGFVQTPMTQWRIDDPELNRDFLAQVPTGKVTQPEEVAEAIALLDSPHLVSVTGQAFVIDGGWTASLGTASADTALAAAASRKPSTQ